MNNTDLIRVALDICGGVAFRSYVHNAFSILAKNVNKDRGLIVRIGEAAIEAGAFVAGYNMADTGTRIITKASDKIKKAAEDVKEAYTYHVNESDSDISEDEEE